ncbi:transposase [Desulfonema magnum]|uniref:Transposase family protein, IS4-like n=1 Tax=Desulfonema magnum TaxID=45655 RepID=A0A975BGD5_9BACT|nr:transposase [Desulfonema magnum]QTA84931.1 Transposase family protein, IS4-like [Desulfonema magnum]
MPVFFEFPEEFECSDETGKSRRRVRIIADDTKSEKFGKCIGFIKKLFDNGKNRHIIGHDYVLLLAVSGDTVIPLSFVMWFPKGHPDHRSKNDIARDEINLLKKECDRREASLGEAEFLADSAFCVQKVMTAAEAAGLRIVTRPGNRHKFEFGGDLLTPNEIVGKTENRQWNYSEAGHCYQRISARHHVYGEVVLVIRRRILRNGKIVHDVLICNKKFYNAVRIHKAYKERWEIEMCFKYYKQYLMFGKSKFRKAASVRSHLSCVDMAGLIVALFRRQCSRKTSFRRAVRLIARELHDI